MRHLLNVFRPGRSRRLVIPVVLMSAALAASSARLSSLNQSGSPGMRLYVMDLGVIYAPQGQPPEAPMPAYLVVHPKGSLLFEAGGIPDDLIAIGLTTVGRAPGADGKSPLTMKSGRTLRDQLRELGYPPQRIDYFVLSHLHFDHVANANDYQASTWLVQKAERDAMFAPKLQPLAAPSLVQDLQRSKTVVLNGDHDVFGDGTVVVKPAPGHTPGHQVLYVKLPKTGGLVLAGDLYHTQQQRQQLSSGQGPAQEVASARAIESFIKASGATLWIEHDLDLFKSLRKAPQYYE